MSKIVAALIPAVLGVLSLFVSPIFWYVNQGLGYLFLAVGIILLVLAGVVAFKKKA